MDNGIKRKHADITLDTHSAISTIHGSVAQSVQFWGEDGQACVAETLRQRCVKVCQSRKVGFFIYTSVLFLELTRVNSVQGLRKRYLFYIQTKNKYTLREI